MGVNKNFQLKSNNGVYIVTAIGSQEEPFILTRAEGECEQ